MRRSEVPVRRLVASWIPAALALALVLGPAARSTAAAADAPVIAHVALGPGSTLWLEGTSNVHDFESRTTELTLRLLRDPAASDPADAAALEQWLVSGGSRGLELGVPLAPMRSGKPGLDKNMLKALRAGEFPEITFRLTRSHVAETPGDTVGVTADGQLRVAGRERPITVTGRLVRSTAGVWLEGSHTLRMSEYDVKPPTMMLGTLRVHDPVVVHFRLLLTPGSPNGGVNAASPH
jgi:hypothetical protein